jgi:hypothetical protein
VSTNVNCTFITCPKEAKGELAIRLPFLMLVLKYLKKYFTFEIQNFDDMNMRRRFRASNYQSKTRLKPFVCTLPMRLDPGWNSIQFNLSEPTILRQSASACLRTVEFGESTSLIDCTLRTRCRPIIDLSQQSPIQKSKNSVDATLIRNCRSHDDGLRCFFSREMIDSFRSDQQPPERVAQWILRRYISVLMIGSETTAIA